MPQELFVIGGTSDIGRATALHFAERGWNIVLAVRNGEAGACEAAHITGRTGRQVKLFQFDILQVDSFPVLISSLSVLPDVVLCAVGELGDQQKAQIDPDYACRILRTNFEGPTIFLGMLAEKFAARGSGVIVGISSVAGERGRRSNYLYGAAKAGFTAFLSGLRNRLAPAGVRVIAIKPGFVRTKMTTGILLPRLLTTDPATVANRIYKAVENPRQDVVYVKPVWRAIMVLVRAIPERVFKHLPF